MTHRVELMEADETLYLAIDLCKFIYSVPNPRIYLQLKEVVPDSWNAIFPPSLPEDIVLPSSNGEKYLARRAVGPSSGFDETAVNDTISALDDKCTITLTKGSCGDAVKAILQIPAGSDFRYDLERQIRRRTVLFRARVSKKDGEVKAHAVDYVVMGDGDTIPRYQYSPNGVLVLLNSIVHVRTITGNEPTVLDVTLNIPNHETWSACNDARTLPKSFVIAGLHTDVSDDWMTLEIGDRIAPIGTLYRGVITICGCFDYQMRKVKDLQESTNVFVGSYKHSFDDEVDPQNLLTFTHFNSAGAKPLIHSTEDYHEISTNFHYPQR